MSENYLLVSLENGVRIIKFNKVHKKNALCAEMYTKISSILNEDAVDDAVAVTIFTGVGEYYCSGADIGNRPTTITKDYDEIIDKKAQALQEFFSALINYPKLLIAVVNGPAVGVSVTTLALFDVVYASDRATFVTPFVTLGLRPEGCSSYTFLRTMGRSKASEMLMLGKKITAQEAYQFGLLSEVIPHKDLDVLMKRLKTYGKISVNFIKASKELIINTNLKKTLQDVNKRECEEIKKCFYSEEFLEAIRKFSARKSKL